MIIYIFVMILIQYKVYQKITIKAKHIRILKIMTGLSPVINE